MDDLLSEFLTETTESLAVLDVELVRLEQNPNDPDLLSNIFRIVHTIKGTCGFLGLPRLESVAHAAENVLGMIREGGMEVSPHVVSLILASLDRIKFILGELEANEVEPDGDDSQLISQLEDVVEGRAPSAPPAAAPAPQPAAAAPEPAAPAEEIVIDEPAAAPPEAAPPEAAPSTAVVPTTEQPAAGAAAAPARQADSQAAPAEGSSVASQSIRVHVDLLENLMNMVSELVLTRNQLLQILRNQKDSDFSTPLQRLNHVTSELQEGVMKTRMQPVGNAWAKLPRMVRDLALDLSKKIDLQMYGADTELDRQVLDLIKDPLAHMVRNSGDHGLETPAERVAAGKPEVGRITLNAYHEGGHIIIEISDDGKGLNSAKIKEKALLKGIVSETEIEQLTDKQIQQFIFKPGFSTAANVTSVSGRGVGMDVVRTNIEKIGGTIELRSQEGRGTTFVIKIPLTLAIVNALIVECSGERFAIPQLSVNELVRASVHSEHRIERIKDTPVLRLRDRLLPLVTLRSLLKLDGDDGPAPEDQDENFIVVVQVGNYVFGLIVDRVFDTEEIVVKPVAPILRHITLFSGNTILGDGSVIMILDPNGIAAATGEISVAGHEHAETRRIREATSDDVQALLLFRADNNTPKAVPLALVARLEEIDMGSVEYSDGRPVVQYRDKLMPLIAINPDDPVPTEGQQPVLVFSDRDHTMGLVVHEIVDIVEERMEVQLTGERRGLLGSAIIDGKATEVIDAGYYLTQAFSNWFDAGAVAADGTSDSRWKVLLIDDSPFFRNLLTPILAVAGFRVTAVESAAEALELRDQGEQFDVIVTDIQMPDMDGFAFATAIRGEGGWRAVPLIALSGHASEQDLTRGREVGFSDYVAKTDREGLMQALTQLVSETV